MKLERLEKLPFLTGRSVGGKTHFENEKKNMLKKKLNQQASTLQNRCMDAEMKELLDHLKEEKAKKEALKTKMKEMLDQELDNLREERIKEQQLKFEMDQQTIPLQRHNEVKWNLHTEIKVLVDHLREEKVKKEQLRIEMMNQLDAKKEELRMLQLEKMRVDKEKEALQIEVHLNDLCNGPL